VFLESRQPKQLADWYARAFGLTFHYWPEHRSYGTEFVYDEGGGPRGRKSCVFVIRLNEHLDRPGAFTVQFHVANVDKVRRALEATGTKVVLEDFDYGRFARLTDCDGTAIELYEPK
jgi:predicted enzyme related to lactoylglutathione lyase